MLMDRQPSQQQLDVLYPQFPWLQQLATFSPDSNVKFKSLIGKNFPVSFTDKEVL